MTKQYEDCQPPFHELPDGRYELLFDVDPKWWAPSRKEGETWKTPIGRFRAQENDGVVAVRKEVE